ncbi:MAG: 2-oxoacid ferredoxin oxidoreductase [Candidatus Micrarchaeota archaeon]|nr:2-oxoacid ferredoxin oxidoreductase [Candidatus Micrarchaeota archaeon]
MMEFNTPEKPQWCPGCGDYGIHTALKQALHEVGAHPKDTVIVSGIGCGSKIPNYVRSYGLEGLHGRVIPTSVGIKIANPELTVIGIGGDGDGFSEGGNHFIHGARENFDIVYIVQDNHIYGLTTGQASPTTPKGMKTKTTPDGNMINEFRPVPMALVAGATFVATAFAGDIMHLKEVIKEAIAHKGFAFIDVYQPCVTWNKLNTYDWYRERVYKTTHDPSDWNQAWEKAWEPYVTDFEKIPLGVIYKKEREIADDFFSPGRKNLVKEPLDPNGIDVSFLAKEFL